MAFGQADRCVDTRDLLIMSDLSVAHPPKFRQPTESHQDYPHDTLANMTTAQKDQFRSLKNVVNSKLTSSLKSRRQAQFSRRALITPSATQSECSTLVDFSLDYLADNVDCEGTDESFLEADNSAWGHSRRSQASASRFQPSNSTPERHETAQMLDADDRAWNGSKQNKSLPTRILHALAGQ
ncbi:hypothetical protein BC835DRAFT_1009466 [Cytidiella melzeri]|nr:hypothetical protein BC835DRAFT_1009466 [Cytidiella melzeri]